MYVIPLLMKEVPNLPDMVFFSRVWHMSADEAMFCFV